MSELIKIKDWIFTSEYQHVLRHIKKNNPHPPGSYRDCLTHGCVPSVYLWIENPVMLQIADLVFFDSVDATVEYQNMLKKTPAPAIIVELTSYGQLCVLDGAHRLEASVKVGKKEIMAFIGVRRTSKEKLLK